MTGGPYRISRNPMYVAVLGTILAEALLYNSWWIAAYAGLVCAGFNERIRRYEEPVLREQFGEQFDAYQQRVRRWL